jgi:hypothetical protein
MSVSIYSFARCCIAWLRSTRRITLFEAVRGKLGTSSTLSTLNSGFKCARTAA